MNCSHKLNRAFTVVELLVSVGVVFLVFLVALRPAGRGTRDKAERIKCIDNLRQLSLAQRQFALDYAEQRLAEDAKARAADYFQIYSNAISTPHILICPTDRRAVLSSNFATLSNLNLSYFANLLARTNDYGVLLFGDRNLQTNGVPVPSGSRLALTSSLEVGWTKEMHGERGNAALSDGSVQHFSGNRLRATLGGNTTNLLLIP